MLASDCEIATVATSKLSIFAVFSALLTLFHMSMALIVVVGVFGFITRRLSLKEIGLLTAFGFEVFF